MWGGYRLWIGKTSDKDSPVAVSMTVALSRKQGVSVGSFLVLRLYFKWPPDFSIGTAVSPLSSIATGWAVEASWQSLRARTSSTPIMLSLRLRFVLSQPRARILIGMVRPPLKTYSNVAAVSLDLSTRARGGNQRIPPRWFWRV